MSAVFLSSDAVLMLTQQLLALALLQQASEMIVLRHAWIDHGIWSLAILQDEFSGLPSPIRRTLCFLLAPRQFAFVLFALFGVAAMLLLGLSMHPALLSAALVLTSLVTVRFRGTFNGGSDYMTLVILSGLTVASLAPLAPWPNSGFPQLSPLAID